MTIDEIRNILVSKLSPKRFKHSVNVMYTAKKLAEVYGIDKDKAVTAGLLHDCARDIRGKEVFEQCSKFNLEVTAICKIQPELLHGPLGAEIARTEYCVSDDEILNAIRWHTTGHETMDLLSKVIYIADYIEPDRNFPGIDEARKLAYEDIDKAMIFSLDRTIKFVISKGALVHPDTIGARNSIIINLKSK
jgi:predicted HD superfamily hydrolase involved in NAD metabolism